MKKRYFIKSVVPVLLCSLLITTTFLVGCDINIGCFGKARYEKTEHLSAPIAADGILAVETEVGSITVTGADVTNCDVTATICAKAPTQREAEEIAEQVKIKTEPVGKTLTVKAEKPHLRNNRSISVSFEITVPKQTALQIETNVGKIDVSNITEQIKAAANVGTITCKEISGDIDLKTDVGKVKVVYSQAAPAACNAAILANVGAITFTAPPDLSAEVDVSANIGSIQTDLPLTVTGKINKSLRGTIGKGEGNVTLRTNVGSIKIK